MKRRWEWGERNEQQDNQMPGMQERDGMEEKSVSSLLLRAMPSSGFGEMGVRGLPDSREQESPSWRGGRKKEK